MSDDYAKAKAALWYSRNHICDVCGKPLAFTGTNAHHCIARQGQAMGCRDRDAIKYEPMNIVLVHQDVCHRKAHADPILCVAIQIVRYGWSTIDEWIQSIPWKVPFSWHRGLTAEEALRIVEEDAPWILEEVK